MVSRNTLMMGPILQKQTRYRYRDCAGTKPSMETKFLNLNDVENNGLYCTKTVL